MQIPLSGHRPFHRPFRQVATGLLLALAVAPLTTYGQAGGDGAVTNSVGIVLIPVEGEAALLSRHLTTVEQWNEFLRASDHPWQPSHHFEQSGRHPAVGINRDDAIAFCEWLTEREQAAGRLTDRQHYRLPFHHEWDSAAGLRGTGIQQRVIDEAAHAWGTQWPPPPEAGNLAAGEIPGYEDAFTYTSPVDQFPANRLGFHDMVGNAWEWAMDQEADGFGHLRGGSWADFNPRVLRAAYRYRVPSRLRAPTAGFRVALDDRDRTADMMAASRDTLQQGARSESDRLLGRTDQEGGDASDVVQRILGPGARPGAEPGSSGPAAAAERPQAGQTWRNSLGTTLVPVPGVNALVASHEVRVEEFLAFVQDSGRGWPQRPGFAQEASHPAAGMTAADAEAFCQWLTSREQDQGLLLPSQRYRLPTDAEWTTMAGGGNERGDSPAARAAGGSHDTYFGNIWPPPFGSGNFEALRIEGYRDAFNFTAPVGSFRPNSLQLYDIEGNVAEWVSDHWQPGSNDRVARGGSWLTHRREEFAISHRRQLGADEAVEDVGFRYVLDTGSP